MLRCMRLYQDPDNKRLIDFCDREEHSDPIHSGRLRDLEWTDDAGHTSGTKMLRKALPEGPSAPRLPLEGEAA